MEPCPFAPKGHGAINGLLVTRSGATGRTNSLTTSVFGPAMSEPGSSPACSGTVHVAMKITGGDVQSLTEEVMVAECDPRAQHKARVLRRSAHAENADGCERAAAAA